MEQPDCRHGKDLTSKRVVQGENELLGINDDSLTLGIALSGGGIRSASFGLGVLQALKEHNILQAADYLSTVSGGGYIGSALTWFRKKEKVEGDDFSFLGKKYSGARSESDGA